MSTTKPSSSNDNARNFDELRHFLACDNPSCRTLNPPKRCARCQSTYYCSVQCQRAHWNHHGHRQECQPIETRRKEWLANFDVPPPPPPVAAFDKGDATATGSCGICLESGIRNPVILSCRHVFCFKCISDYQGCKDLLLDRTNKECPYCRTKIEGHVIDEALERASVFMKRVFFLSDEYDDSSRDERNELLRLASAEADKVLEADPKDLVALVLRAQLLQHADPLEAVKVLQQALEIDRVGMIDRAKVDAMIAQVNMVRADGNSNAADEMTKAINHYMSQYEHWPRTFGVPGPRRLWSVQLALALAYEAAGQYDEAFSTYMTMKMCESNDDYSADECRTYFGLLSGLSGMAYQVGDYLLAIDSAEDLMSVSREMRGTHKLVALPLLAMAEQAKSAGTVMTFKTGNSYRATLEGVIEVMYKGFVYEVQYDDKNKRTNRAFLQELFDKKAATEKTKGAVEADTSNSLAAAGIPARVPPNTRGKKKGHKNKKRGGKSN